MDWSVYMEYLSSILNKFHSFAALTDDFLIRYFRHGLKPSIRAQLDKKNRDLNDEQAVIKGTVDAKAKAAQQALLLAWISNAYCFHDDKPLQHQKLKDPKDSQAKKNDFPIVNSKNGGQSDQALGRSSKKDFRSYKKSQQGQSSNTSETCNNAIVAKKDET